MFGDELSSCVFGETFKLFTNRLKETEWQTVSRFHAVCAKWKVQVRLNRSWWNVNHWEYFKVSA